jgi:hypothetical protein
MARVFDEADYRRRLDALSTSNTPVGTEVGLLIKGFFQGDVLGPVRAHNEILLAKQEALRQARKALVKQIQAEMDKRRNDAIIPLDVQEIITGGEADELVKVP